MPDQQIKIYTDGSCHTQLLTGAWAAIIFLDGEKTILSGIVHGTTHNRMELTAVLEAVTFVRQHMVPPGKIEVVTDSQYVTQLQARQQKFIEQHFTTKKGNEVSNADLVKTFLSLLKELPVIFTKTKAHQKKTGTPNYNIEADKLSRSLVRQAVKELKQ